MDSICDINPIECSQVKNGHHVIMNSRPCKVVHFTHAKTGKHGHMKVHLTGMDVLTGKKVDWLNAGHVAIMQFKLIKKEYQLVLIDSNVFTCLNENMKEIYVTVDEESKIYKQIKTDLDAGRLLLLAVITAPVEASAGKFVDTTIVDSYKEDKST